MNVLVSISDGKTIDRKFCLKNALGIKEYTNYIQFCSKHGYAYSVSKFEEIFSSLTGI